MHFTILALLYESPGGNQIDGLPPARHTGAVAASSKVGVSHNR